MKHIELSVIALCLSIASFASGCHISDYTISRAHGFANERCATEVGWNFDDPAVEDACLDGVNYGVTAARTISILGPDSIDIDAETEAYRHCEREHGVSSYRLDACNFGLDLFITRLRREISLENARLSHPATGGTIISGPAFSRSHSREIRE